MLIISTRRAGEATTVYVSSAIIAPTTSRTAFETNIWAGFSAAKEAMENSTQPKSDRYIIFFSDGANGVNNNGDGPDGMSNSADNWRKIVIPECPTTFSIFFNPKDKGAIKELDAFTKTTSTFWKNTVANNGYSTSNPKSDLWSIEAGREALVDTLMKNVIADIIKTTTKVIPTKISIQGSNNLVWNENDSSFTFTNLFPLNFNTDTTTVSYTINYNIIRDSTDVNGNVIPLDTTPAPPININYNAILKQNPTAQLPYSTLFWNRDLNGKEQDTLITVVESPIGELQVEFIETKVDTLYDYKNIEVLITTKNGDREIVSLVKNGNSFTAKLPRSIGSATAGDNRVQHDGVDTITLSYANPDLPRDTISTKIPVDANRVFSVKQVSYFDSFGDGKVDKIFIDIDGDSLVDQLTELSNSIALPTQRSLTINSTTKTSTGLALDVSEGGPMTTATQNYDRTSISSTLTLSDGSLIFAFDLEIRDSIAPVLTSASLVDSIKNGAQDVVSVTYSENISDIFSQTPLLFWDNGVGSTSPNLDKLSLTGNSASFEVVGGVNLSNNDSLNISLSTPECEDSKNIKQRVQNNIKVPLIVSKIADGLQINSAENRDTNGDGKVDQIILGLSQNWDGGDLNLLLSHLSLSSERNFSNISALKDGQSIKLTLKENNLNLNTGLFSG